jgi:hypothetical protein
MTLEELLTTLKILGYNIFNVRYQDKNTVTFFTDSELKNAQFIFTEYRNIHCKYAKITKEIYCVVITQEDNK